MEWQLNALSSLGLLSRFIGMITDSRSFMSYPRHEYFRRVLCNLIGRDMEQGLLPDDEEMVGTMIRDICYSNARDFMRFPGIEETHSTTKTSRGKSGKPKNKGVIISNDVNQTSEGFVSESGLPFLPNAI